VKEPEIKTLMDQTSTSRIGNKKFELLSGLIAVRNSCGSKACDLKAGR